jgi:hypothetical protein
MEHAEKLQVLLPHWIEHNKGHAAECLKWAERAEVGGEIEKNLSAAYKAMDRVNEHLAKALAAAGGAASSEHHHHHHH